VSEREAFVGLAVQEGVGFAELCRRFGISRKTGYKWLGRYQAAGVIALADRSRRPYHSPGRTSLAVERAVLAVRAEHPAWGGRKIRRVLQNRGQPDAPAASTITAILHRHGLIDEAESAPRHRWQRFEHPHPNDLWQMDFKGHFATGCGRCHPLTVLDDHSRYCLGLQACDNERGITVQTRLTSIFRRYGLPRRMLMDNGSPWAGDETRPWAPLTVWMLRLGIGVSHGRPYHPQTQGKDERFHRTLQAELLNSNHFDDLAHCQRSFDRWRPTYNQRRPHEALDLDTPASRYAPSPRSYPETLPAIEYGPGDLVRRVQYGGAIHVRGQVFRISKAFRGYPIGLRPTATDGVWDVYFCRQRVAWIDQRTGTSGSPHEAGDDRVGPQPGEAGGGSRGSDEFAPACRTSVRYAHSSPTRGGRYRPKVCSDPAEDR
jgi:transposase InsO family protein